MFTNITAPLNHSLKLPRLNRPAIFSTSSFDPGKKRDTTAGYIAALAHEIRNPLCTINLALEMLNPMDLDEEGRQYLDIIRRGSDRIKDLISTILKPDQAKEARYELYSLHQLLDEVLIMADDRISLKKITVSREYYATADGTFLNSENMKIALSNIVINAVDAMPLETGKLELVTRSTQEQVFIEIHDNGIGISKVNLKRIFEPYFTNKPDGMGLGLSATLDILRANHATVNVRSAEGIGTCFSLSFDMG